MNDVLIFLLQNQDTIMEDINNILISEATTNIELNTFIHDYITKTIQSRFHSYDQETLLLVLEDNNIQEYIKELINYFSAEDINEYKNTLH